VDADASFHIVDARPPTAGGGFVPVDAAHIHSLRHKTLFLNLREPLKLDDKEFSARSTLRRRTRSHRRASRDSKTHVAGSVVIAVAYILACGGCHL
jgi:hypothetical protein